jgi:CRISPR-associated exonuclease Cas4
VACGAWSNLGLLGNGKACTELVLRDRARHRWAPRRLVAGGTMMWALVIALGVLLAAASLAHFFGVRASRQAGLPDGAIVYQDTADSGSMVAALVSHRHGLVGRPDYLIETDQGVVPVELKNSRCPPRGPFDNHVAQLMGYCLLVEDSMGKTVPEGVLRYQDREIRVPFTREQREWVCGIVLAVRAAKGGAPVRRSHQISQKCRGCSVRSSCRDSL